FVRCAAGDRVTADFTGTNRLGAVRGATGRERRRAFENVEDVGVAFVNLHLAWHHATAGLDLVVRREQNRQAFGQGVVDDCVIDDDGVGGRRAGRRGVGGGKATGERGGNESEEETGFHDDVV